MEERAGTYRILVGNPQVERLLGRYNRGWEYNIKMELEEIG
jgi:hypothetical protein